ncbi:MAG: pantoate--beta-alanine ligase [Planctomycetes bacterium]|nr:pantoate--beta-alanine ligase [Planctomycetota bacterium]
MIVTRSSEEAARWARAYRTAGLSTGFVPTLGGLHEGHHSLLRRARSECEKVIASVYLNPTQFHSAEDLEKYPASEEEDLAALRRERADLVYLGRAADLLPDGFQSWVDVEILTRPLCGAFRPGHFRGVTTVVAQLFSIIRPHRAYFGLKDYQQAAVVRRMARDLSLGVEIRLCPTVREASGLAISSRNRRLSAGEREAACVVHRALEAARRAIEAGEDRIQVLLAALEQQLGSEPLFRTEYAEIVDAATLERFGGGRIEWGERGVLVAVAGYIGSVRLIDSEWIEARP